ncbi:intradiol ring-cleavage dioxygenase [Pelagibius litoralis]|uniref:Intradiol ring-cleavage dioxygenase n=1 Tax=Pelagibius litoralis TaxID=374515 RepID=A0A967CC20_9PROT|nr:protocatechuate 3,4-dioxygenase [Pelagibius litoralis]NIA68669.1 intradiol ring-cleavage dioxygenase [Pelagibius litoralis]
MTKRKPVSRRRLLESSPVLGVGVLGALGLGISAGGRLAAAQTVLTPRQSPGPFYPERLPHDADQDLTQVEGRDRPASGQRVQISGRVADEAGRPLAGAVVEIWQCDAFGYYHHPRDRGGRADPNFQGYGRLLLGEDGRYRFTTIRPVAYPGRAPHIHFAVSGPGVSRLTTQMYLAGHAQNERDFLYNAIRDRAARKAVTVAFTAAESGQPAQGQFDLVLGRSLSAD